LAGKCPARGTIKKTLHLLKPSGLFGWLHGRSGQLPHRLGSVTISCSLFLATSLPSRRRAKSRSLFVATAPSCSPAVGRLLNHNLLLGFFGRKLVGASRFERPTSCSQGRRANQAALRPDTRFFRYFVMIVRFVRRLQPFQ
jgi:hypothetical protein